MEHELRATGDARVTDLLLAAGDAVNEGELLLISERITSDSRWSSAEIASDPPPPALPGQPQQDAAAVALRPDLQRVIDRHAFTFDASRPQAVAKRHALGQRTARENIADLVRRRLLHRIRRAGGGRATQPAQRRRPDPQHAGRRHGDRHRHGQRCAVQYGATPEGAPDPTRAVVMAYDATVLAGTQGMRNHAEDRPHAGHCAATRGCPWCCSPKAAAAGRATPTCPSSPACMSPPSPALPGCRARCRWSASSAGRCFAGNAALLGCSDVIIATRSSNIGMGGPAMVEGGGLGVFKPEQIGPGSVQHAQWRDRHPGGGRSRGGGGRAALPVVLPGPHARLDQRPTRWRCATWCRRTACASTTRARP